MVTTKHPQLGSSYILLPPVWFLTCLFNISERTREQTRSQAFFRSATAGARLCTLWCCFCSGWYPVPTVSSAGTQCPRFHLLASSSNNHRARQEKAPQIYWLWQPSAALLFSQAQLTPSFPAARLSSAGNFSPSNVHPAPGTPLQLLCLLPLPTDLLSFCGAVSTCFGHQLCHFFSVQTHTFLSCTQKHKQPQRPRHVAMGACTPRCCFHLLDLVRLLVF